MESIVLLVSIHLLGFTVPWFVHGGYQVEFIHQEVLVRHLSIQAKGVVLTPVLYRGQ